MVRFFTNFGAKRNPNGWVTHGIMQPHGMHIGLVCKNGPVKENREKKKRKRGKGKRKRKECHVVSRPGRRRTQNYTTRGRFPPTPVHFMPRGCVEA